MKVLWLVTSSMCLEPTIGSLEYCQPCLWTETYRFDKNPNVDLGIMGTVETFQPDLVLYIGPANGPHLPQIETFKEIKKNRLIVNLCCDGSCPGWHPLLQTYASEDCFNLTINMDGGTSWPHRMEDFTMWHPIDPRPYRKWTLKDILLGFCGGKGSPDRSALIDALNKIITVGTRNENLGTYQDYADFMLRSQFALNMNLSGGGKPQWKNRVTEAGLARCCLLEPKDSPIAEFFKPGIDYLEYSSASDIERIISTTDPDSSATHGEFLRNKVMGQFHPKKFWDVLFKEIQ